VTAQGPQPTTAAPGSPDRIAVYRARAQRGEQVFHPADEPNARAGETVRQQQQQPESTPRVRRATIEEPPE
jgi:hypothetical protein